MKGVRLARLNVVATFPVPWSIADSAAISLSLSEKFPFSLTKISILSRSTAGFKGELSVYVLGGSQLRYFAGRVSPPPVDPLPGDPPPPPADTDPTPHNSMNKKKF